MNHELLRDRERSTPEEQSGRASQGGDRVRPASVPSAAQPDRLETEAGARVRVPPRLHPIFDLRIILPLGATTPGASRVHPPGAQIRDQELRPEERHRRGRLRACLQGHHQAEGQVSRWRRKAGSRHQAAQHLGPSGRIATTLPHFFPVAEISIQISDGAECM
jgi:hypothetical protein